MFDSEFANSYRIGDTWNKTFAIWNYYRTNEIEILSFEILDILVNENIDDNIKIIDGSVNTNNCT